MMGKNNQLPDTSDPPQIKSSDVLQTFQKFEFKNLNVKFIPAQSGQWLVSNISLGEETFLCLNIETSENLVAKQISKELEHNMEMLEKDIIFRKRVCEHPNIVGYVGRAEAQEGTNSWDVYEMMEMDSLLTMLKSLPMTLTFENLIKSYTRGILSGLSHLHEFHIVHRHIKADNVLVDWNGVAKLHGFEGSKSLDKSATTDDIVNDVWWLPPEVCADLAVGLRDVFSYAADIWSVGCTVIEMANGGLPPWFDTNTQELAQEGVEEWEKDAQSVRSRALSSIAKFQKPPPIPGHLSEKAKNFILCCCHVDPLQRPSAEELLHDPFLLISPKEGHWTLGEPMDAQFGTIYKCTEVHSGFQFAVRQFFMSDMVPQEEIKKEMEILMNVGFAPNIVQYLGSEFSKDSEQVFIFLELMEIENPFMNESDEVVEKKVQKCMSQVVRGLEHLHGKQVLHRDVRAANVVCNKKGTAKLANFGLQKLLRHDAGENSKSVWWMAPELIKGPKNGYDTATDIWSVGCTVIEMLNGGLRPWFDKNTKRPIWEKEGNVHKGKKRMSTDMFADVAAYFKILEANRPPPLPKNCSADAEKFILACCQMDPRDRPSASELLKHPFLVVASKADSGSLSAMKITSSPNTIIGSWKHGPPDFGVRGTSFMEPHDFPEIPPLEFDDETSANNLNLLTISGSWTDGTPEFVVRKTGFMENAEVRSLDDLKFVRPLGRGNGGSVTLVQHKQTQKLYALKVMALRRDEEMRQQIKEVKINVKPLGEHIVKCFQAFHREGTISIVLEYMNGGSLADVIEAHQSIREEYLVEIARQSLRGLDSLHSKHFIHRDIKPANILINSDGMVKIADFGVSAILLNTAAVTSTAKGTITFMSPERISGGKYSYNCDIWSLGLTILMCATGRFPYGPVFSEFNLYNLIVEGPAPSASTSQFSENFCSFIAMCLQKDPKMRASAAQALEHPFIGQRVVNRVNVGELCTP